MHSKPHPAVGTHHALRMVDAPASPVYVIDWVDRLAWWMSRLASDAACSRRALVAYWSDHEDELVLCRIGTRPVIVHENELGDFVEWNPLEGVETE